MFSPSDTIILIVPGGRNYFHQLEDAIFNSEKYKLIPLTYFNGRKLYYIKDIFDQLGKLNFPQLIQINELFQC